MNNETAATKPLPHATTHWTAFVPAGGSNPESVIYSADFEQPLDVVYEADLLDHGGVRALRMMIVTLRFSTRHHSTA
jgi:hypothetical protein